MLAFIDLFWFIGLVTFAILPLVFLMKRPKTRACSSRRTLEARAALLPKSSSLAYQQTLAPEVQTTGDTTPCQHTV